MNSAYIQARGSTLTALIYFCAGLPFDIWSGVQLLSGDSLWQPSTFLIAFFGFIYVALGIEIFTERLLISDGELRIRRLLTTRSVNLRQLTHAERSDPTIALGVRSLLLEDQNKQKIVIKPLYFNKRDRAAIAAAIHPYIFITRVEKNFSDLRFMKL